MNPRVTVAIPNRNQGHYLAEAVASALGQTYPVHEVIVANDGSTDDSLEAARSFSDQRLRIYDHVRPVDATSNWNFCFTLARGEYIVLLRPQDALHPEMVEKLVERAEREPQAAIVNCDYEMVLERTGRVEAIGMWYHHGDSVRNQTFDGRPLIEMMLKRGDNTIGTTSMQLIRLDAIRAVAGADPRMGYVTDWDFAIRLLARHGGLSNVAEPLVRYRMNAGDREEGFEPNSDLLAHTILLEGLVGQAEAYGYVASDAVEAFRRHVAERILGRAKQLTAIGERTGADYCNGLLRRPVFEGIVAAATT